MPPYAPIRWQNGQPFSTEFDDVYFSSDSGLAESHYVFIQHNQLIERFTALPEHGRFCIAETGFGSGLNFLCAAACFIQYAPASTRLHFVSVEKHPLSPADMQQALALWPSLQILAQELIAQYQLLAPGWQRLLLADGRITLTLLIGDVLERLPELDARVDAWFLDGFAPAKNPDMWQLPLFQQMARLSVPGGTFATFTSAGTVRRGLAEAGFHVQKSPGFGRKREMSHGHLAQLPASHWQPPWFARPPTHSGERSAIVIGAGIAGAATAYSLARRGWQVTVLERLPQAAAAASGNPQGMLYTKLSAHFTAQTQLILSGYGYSLRLLRQLLPQAEDSWQACGVLQLAHQPAEAQKQAKLAALGLAHDLMRPVDASEASKLAGIALTQGGLFFPQGGWVHPPALVNKLLEHPGIQLQTDCTISGFHYEQQQQLWQVHEQDGTSRRAAVLILTNAGEAASFDATGHLPLQITRGQITLLRSTVQSAALQTVLCSDGYIAPARHQQHCLGATFQASTDLSIQAADHQQNLQMLAQLAPSLHSTLSAENHELTGRSALRCSSPDYLPLIGPLTAPADFLAYYQSMYHGIKPAANRIAPWLSGLYINTAHGSRGLISAPLSGEILAALLENEPAPLSHSLMQAIHPNRFLLRDLVHHRWGTP
ncbi:bifunctional tRNA (5-methylaminomethyl-2-thiouridine)(34)-methyltransferase MnmD/FAD-dependent 5-carboxymethylaminomethyl-2-thiouridine(34) oxidoreductase MnmC [Neisseriaceae bacterium TC5R-5]|nr:bifunctional tRNA (5-methylaminomethyl-2-thiouridine)(34)-methyltransferase MnmD/FAD-dependent 5-carboxymethylaminomethyl-2-thiouridine(34) oxidoreductase MnmC [Neisseriaceae bacterium TC5R-5]